MSGGGGGGNTQTIQKADPWSGLQPYLSDLFKRSNMWLNSGQPSFYPGSTVAGQAPETLNAQYAQTQRALQGSPLQSAAQATGYKTLRGDYLGSNPYLNEMFTAASNPLIDQFSRAVAPSITSQFAAAGRYGSGAHEAALTDASGRLAQALGSMGAQIYGPAYEAERGRQQQMIGMGPQLAGLDYNDIAKLAEVGQQRQQTAQDLINANIARWDFGQNRDLQKLQAFSQLIQGGSPYGQSTSQTKLPQTGGFNAAGALGGGLAGMQLASALGAGGGAAAGAGAAGAAGAAAPALMSNPYGWMALAAGALLGSGLF